MSRFAKMSSSRCTEQNRELLNAWIWIHMKNLWMKPSELQLHSHCPIQKGWAIVSLSHKHGGRNHTALGVKLTDGQTEQELSCRDRHWQHPPCFLWDGTPGRNTDWSRHEMLGTESSSSHGVPQQLPHSNSDSLIRDWVFSPRQLWFKGLWQALGQSSRMLTVARAHRCRWHTGTISDHAKRTMAWVRYKRYPFDCNTSLINDSKPEQQVGMLGNKRCLQKQIGNPDQPRG